MDRKLLAALAFVVALLGCVLVLGQSASAHLPTASTPHSVSGASRPDSITYPLQEGFESGDFSVSAFYSVVPTCVPGGCGWNLASPVHSGGYAAFAPERNNVSDQQMVSASLIAIPANPVTATLEFWHKYSFETPNYDGGVLELSTNSGSSWTDVLSTTTFISGGYTGTIDGTFHNPLANRQAWIGTNSNYTKVTVSLLPFAGQNLLFRFRMGTDDCCTGTASGWNIDDIIVTLSSSAPCPTPPPTTWNTGAPYPIAVADQAVVAHRGKVYSFGGYSGINSTNPVTNSYSYDPNTDSWTAIAGLPLARGGNRAVSSGVYIYILGGRDISGNRTSTLWRYDSVANTYTTLISYGYPSDDHAAVYVNGNIFKIAGSAGPQVEVYNINSGWISGYSYPQNVLGLSAVAYGTVLYAAGGSPDTLGTYSDPNPASYTWSSYGTLPGARYGAASGVLNGRWFLAGGWVSGAASSTALVSNPGSNNWTRFTSLPQERYYSGGATNNQIFYVIGGYDISGNPTSTNYQYSEQTCAPFTPAPTNTAAPTNTPTTTPVNANAYAHFQPSMPLTVTVGSKFTLDLMINGGTNTITAAQNYLTFTNSILQVVDPVQTGCVLSSTVVPDTAIFDAELQNQVCNSSSSCSFGSVTAPPASIAFASGALVNPPAQGDFRVAQVAFCANAVGDAVIHWQFSPPAPSGRDSNIADVNNNLVSNRALYTDYVVHVVPILLVGHVNWQGRPAQPSTRQQLPITLTLKLGANQIDYPTQTTNSSGFFTVSVAGLVSGTYGWRVKDPIYLANAGTVLLTGAATTYVEMGLMLAGDANNDNVVSTVDFNILRSAFGQVLGDPSYDSRADFNGDNVINLLDFGLLRTSFGVSGAPPIRPSP